MAFSKGFERLQQIISFTSIGYRTKKKIMEHLRDCNIVISYKTLDRDLKQIREELHLNIDHKRNVGYKIENVGFPKNRTVINSNLLTLNSNCHNEKQQI